MNYGMSDQQFFTGSFGGGNPYYKAPVTTETTPVTGGSNNFLGLDDAQFQKLFGGAEGVGAVSQIAGIGNALAQSWLGFQQYGLAKDMFNFQREAFDKNYQMQLDSYNTAKENQTNTAAKQNA